MAQYTANYQLHQWEPQDTFLRTDFNQDFQRLDTALAGVRAVADGKVAPAALAAVEALANQKCRVIIGSYIGSGELTQTIALGVRPKVVVIDNTQRPSTALELALDGPKVRSITVTDGGFSVMNTPENLNVQGTQYPYLALV